MLKKEKWELINLSTYIKSIRRLQTSAKAQHLQYCFLSAKKFGIPILYTYFPGLILQDTPAGFEKQVQIRVL